MLDDADPKKAAADAAYACFSAAGQLCVSMERIYVTKGVADAFTSAFAERVAGLKIGSAFDYSTDVGSLTTATQLENVTAHLDDAVAKGATVLAGGKARPDLGPYFIEPTVLTNVTSDMACFGDETFGALVAVTVVEDAEAAVAAANDSEYGLNASVLSGSRSRGRKVAGGMKAGSVNVNEGYRATFGSVDAPMGGVKQSGLGRRNGPEGLLRFTESRTIAEATGLLQLPHNGPGVSPSSSDRCSCCCARCVRSVVADATSLPRRTGPASACPACAAAGRRRTPRSATRAPRQSWRRRPCRPRGALHG